MSVEPDDDETVDTITTPKATPPSASGRFRLLRWLALAFGGEEPGGSDTLPERIGPYRVIEKLGEGGMGRVYVAEDPALKRRIAVKVLKDRDDTARRRFLREARAAAKISHPNVCPIFEVGEDRGVPYIAMELLSGETLATRLRRGPLSVGEALEVVGQVLSALDTVHHAEIVHRDVKPSNVFLTAHGARLLDFGLARELPKAITRAVQSSSETTSHGLVLGTVGYMPPEQILGQRVDRRADLFATAVVLYEAVTGRRPFSGDSAVQLLSAALHEEPLPLTGSPAMEMLDAPVRRGLSKSPDQRYSSARDMAEALLLAQQAAQNEAAVVSPSRDVFVGRRAELSALREGLAAALAATGTVVFVTGERGAGKSTLVSHFLRTVKSGTQTLSIAAGRCAEPRGPGEAFLPFLDAVGRLMTGPGRDRTAELLRSCAPAVASSSGLLADPDGSLRRQAVGATKERLIREAGDFLEASSREFPIVLFLEDLHWADAASVELLHHFGSRLTRQRILIIGTYRRADAETSNPALKRCALDLVARGVGREITLGALSGDDVQAYLDARFPANRFPPALGRTVHARTEGLALFARSFVDLLVERRDILRDEEKGWRLARPVEQLDLEPTKGLADLVRQQIEMLPEEEQELLRHASVCGRDFLSTVVADLKNSDVIDVEESLQVLCDVRRLILDRGEEELPDGSLAMRYRFSHALYQSVLYQNLVASRRVQLHAKTADLLRRRWGADAPKLAAEIAQHCELGRDFAGAVAYRMHAGDNGARRFAYTEALGQYDWAERLLDRLSEEERLSARLRLRARRGALHHTQARFDAAADDFRAMLEEARAAHRIDEEREALASLCDTLFYARRVDEMAVRVSELLAVAERTGRPGDVVEARSRLGQVLACQGRFEEAVPVLDEVETRARETGPVVALQTALAFRGLIRYWRAQYAGSEADFTEAATIASDRADGLQVFEETIAIARRNGDGFWLPRLLTQKGMVHRELLAFDRARELDAEALQLAREKPVAWAPEADALLNLVVDDVRVGNVERAEGILAEIEKRSEESDWLSWMNELRLRTAAAERWAARGSWAQATEMAERLLDHARGLEARGYVCSAERVRLAAALAEDRDVEPAIRRLEDAIDGLREFEAPLETWTAWRLLGRAYEHLGRNEPARRARGEAARAIREIAGHVEEEPLRSAFLQAPAVREVLGEP